MRGSFNSVLATVTKRVASVLCLVLIQSSADLRAQGCSASCPDVCTEVSDMSVPYTISGPTDYCQYAGTGCSSSNAYSWNGCCRTDFSPILIDIEGDGFDMTDLTRGVTLRVDPRSQHSYRVSLDHSGVGRLMASPRPQR